MSRPVAPDAPPRAAWFSAGSWLRPLPDRSWQIFCCCESRLSCCEEGKRLPLFSVRVVAVVVRRLGDRVLAASGTLAGSFPRVLGAVAAITLLTWLGGAV